MAWSFRDGGLRTLPLFPGSDVVVVAVTVDWPAPSSLQEMRRADHRFVIVALLGKGDVPAAALPAISAGWGVRRTARLGERPSRWLIGAMRLMVWCGSASSPPESNIQHLARDGCSARVLECVS